MKYLLKLIPLILLVSLLIPAAIPTDAHAFSSATSGAVVDSLKMDNDSLSTYAEYNIAYGGQQSDGDYVVIVNDGSHRLATYEISEDGSIKGLINSSTLDLFWSDDGIVLLRQYESFDDQLANGDWYFAVCEDSVSSIQITQEGAIGAIAHTNTAGDSQLEAVRVYDNFILTYDNDEVLRTYYMDSDHTVISSDSHNLASASSLHTHDIVLLDYGGFSDRTYFVVTAGSNYWDYWRVGYIEGSPGYYASNPIHIDGETTRHGDLYKSSYSDTQLVTDSIIACVAEGYYGGAPGLSGNSDFVLHTIHFTGSGDGEQVAVDTAYLEDTVGYYKNAWSILPFGDGSAALVYNQDSKLKMRMLLNLTSSGSLSQSQITTDLEVAAGRSRQCEHHHWVTRIGDTNMSAILWSPLSIPSASQNLIIVEHYIPPTVETESVVPLLTTYNTKIDGAIAASGAVTDMGSSEAITEWGMCYNTTGFPDYSGSRTSNTGTQTTTFDWDEEILDLETTDKYYVCAYALGDSGIAYGETLDLYTFPEYANTIELLHFEPDQISSGTISDQSGHGHDVSFTLLANPGSLTLEYGPIDTADWYYSGSQAELLLIQDEALDTDEYEIPTKRTFTGLPGMDMINTQLDNANIPQAFFWLPLLTALIVLIGFAAYWVSKDMIAMSAGCGLGIVLCVTFGWFPWWFIPTYVIPAYATVIGQRASGGQHL